MKTNKKYTRKQIQEAISYWKKQLHKRSLNENIEKTFTCDPDENEACACEVFTHEAFNSGDEVQLYVGKNPTSVYNGIMESFVIRSNEIIIKYKGMQASYYKNFAKFMKIMDAIRLDSTKGRISVEATLQIAWQDGYADTDDEFDEQIWEFNYYAFDGGNTRNVFYCV